VTVDFGGGTKKKQTSMIIKKRIEGRASQRDILPESVLWGRRDNWDAKNCDKVFLKMARSVDQEVKP